MCVQGQGLAQCGGALLPSWQGTGGMGPARSPVGTFAAANCARAVDCFGVASNGLDLHYSAASLRNSRDARGCL
jgi:hypothetical protein